MVILTPCCRDGYLHGSPELVVEIAGSSASYDFGEKRDVYQSAGVNEYLVCETHENQIAWWRLVDGRYAPIESEQSILKSAEFPGLWLDVKAFRSADGKRMLKTLRDGMREAGMDQS